MGSSARAANVRRVASRQRSGITIASANVAVMQAGWQEASNETVTACGAVGIAQRVRFGAAEQRTRGRVKHDYRGSGLEGTH